MSKELYPKFVLVYSEELKRNVVIIGMCVYHRELPSRMRILDNKSVIGGGWFKWHLDSGLLIFNQRSEDFGHCELKDVYDCLINGDFYERTSKKFPLPMVKRFTMEHYLTKDIIDIDINHTKIEENVK